MTVIACSQAAGQPALSTRWSADVNPDAPLPEYPRPALERERWLNLNGRWQWAPADEGDGPPFGRDLARSVVVPFPIESSLSGIGESHERSWYRRLFEVPPEWSGQRVVLHFGAVDWEAHIHVNGRLVGSHRGGYDPFSFDITDFLAPAGPQELVVHVIDPTDAGEQPRGKQIRNPHGIWYTAHTGIWQTVWIEPVHPDGLASVEIVPDLAMGVFKVKATRRSPGPASNADTITATVYADGERVQRHQARPDAWFVLKPGKPRPWTPDHPFLYDIIIEVERAGEVIDSVKSYAGLRSVSIGHDAEGRAVILLNQEPVFQVGPLDQGYWPDGLSTAPTDEALRYDLEITRQLGFNMTRKHVKVEPQRWYYWADRLGLLVWQDMPSGGPYIGPSDPDAIRDPHAARQFESELSAVINALRHHPSIIMWVPFNEGWGQYDTARITELVKRLDPTRLVNSASGWTDRGVGDVIDWHVYPAPASPPPESRRAAVLGEFGGIGLPVPGHMWKTDHWGYKGVRDAEALTRLYESYMQRVYDLRRARALSAAVYTQLTDVEIECNGLLTYDRAVIKADPVRVAAVNRGDFSLMPPPPTITAIVSTSEHQPQRWRITTDRPAPDWFMHGFDDSSWLHAPGGFGTPGTPGAVVGTRWDTPSIWARRLFDLDSVPAGELHLRIHHDEDCEVYINGVKALSLANYTTEYEDHPIPPSARAALRKGPNVLAVHCRQTRGGQYIDAGLVRIEYPPVPTGPSR
ncbi:MAG: glycoside hydrolase family 2 [Phycisphaerae bacterium]|nr:glycoside hydrolase family 2 [Phycisphaerae bacterium]